MEVAAKLSGARISAQKARLVADQVRGLPAARALDLLKFSDKKAAHMIHKLLWSAVSNAENNVGADADALAFPEAQIAAAPAPNYAGAGFKGEDERGEPFEDQR